MKVCLVRHGETEWSLAGRHTGISNIALTPHGQAQATALAARLQGLAFTQVWVSPRLRARQTCELAGYAAQSTVETDLCEWDYGRYEGLRTAEIHRERPGWNIWHDGCPEGELPVDITVRADRLIARICQLPGPVLLFSHGQFGAALAVRWIGLDVAQAQHLTLQAASVAFLGVDPQHPEQRTIECWNQGYVPQPTTPTSATISP